jgi:stage V sporulation protein G
MNINWLNISTAPSYQALLIFLLKNIRRKKMQITDIKVRKLFDDGPMKAIVSVTFDGQLAVHDIKVINAREKFFIVMPSRKNPDETYRDIVHPINAQFRSMLEGAVIAAYEQALADAELVENAEDTEQAEIATV